ncbi:carboxypeptidase-like regulatory domain-containing protein [Spirosoma telluris]|uniref:carboxypeptidase-like regulatory domain-containing protein n=1 Tax=Spirosoma telluris TaxID=2183553 RepID=UPI002FC3A55A
MIRSLRILVLVAGITGYLLDIPPLQAQLLAQNRVKNSGNTTSSSGTLTLREALMQVKKQYNVDILFEEKLLEGISVSTSQIQTSQSLERNLSKMLQPVGLRFKKVSKVTYVILMAGTELKTSYQEPSPDIQSLPILPQPTASSLQTASPQATNPIQALDKVINGVVTSETGEVLPGVSVVVKSSTRGTTTDADGRYRLNVPDEASTLVFSFVGYQNQEVAIGNRTVLDVRLLPDQKTLNEVVVVGYGTQKREQITSAIASVKAEDFVKGPVQDAAQLIRGKVAGLSVITPDGNPTSTAQISLRGNATINASSSPLILIDGVPGALNTVAPEDIESIDVLKDGSAAAIYGTRGTNGVILITTRKVKGETPPTIEVNSYFTTQRQTRQLSFMNADQYRQLVSQKKPGATDYGSNTNWLNEVTQKPLSQVHNISLRGGSRSTNYIMSLEYRSLNGVMKKSDNSILYPRIEINHTMFNGLLKLNANLSGYQQKYFAVDGGTYSGLVYRNALTFNPTEAIRDANGNWTERTDKTDYMNPLALIEESRGRTETIIFEPTAPSHWLPSRDWK